MRRIRILDVEAYKERLAIIEVDAPEVSNPQARWRAEYEGYGTRLSIVMTEAANGDWKLVKELCREEREKFGDEHARELMRYIQERVREKIEPSENRKRDRSPLKDPGRPIRARR